MPERSHCQYRGSAAPGVDRTASSRLAKREAVPRRASLKAHRRWTQQFRQQSDPASTDGSCTRAENERIDRVSAHNSLEDATDPRQRHAGDRRGLGEEIGQLAQVRSFGDVVAASTHRARDERVTTD